MAGMWAFTIIRLFLHEKLLVGETGVYQTVSLQDSHGNHWKVRKGRSVGVLSDCSSASAHNTGRAGMLEREVNRISAAERGK